MTGSKPFFSRTALTQLGELPVAYRIGIGLLVSMHIAGLIGLNWAFSRPLFLALVPFNLITTAAIVLFFHTTFNRPFVLFCVIVFLVGFGVEVLGVHSGVIFGHYVYGPVLGWKLWDVPLVIGCNWLALIYCTGVIAEKVLETNWLKPVLAALLMVSIDLLIEPVAIFLNFWRWHGEAVPFRNYVGWFVVSLLLQIGFRLLVTHKNNSVAFVVYMVQLVFFLGCNLLIWLPRH